jgi:hypothetical protein
MRKRQTRRNSGDRSVFIAYSAVTETEVKNVEIHAKLESRNAYKLLIGNPNGKRGKSNSIFLRIILKLSLWK